MSLKRLRKLKSREVTTFQKIHQALEAESNKPLPYIPKESHKPSEFGQDCLRRIYYSYFKVEPDKKFDAAILKIFDTGRAIEEMVMKWLKMVGEHIPYLNKDGSIPKDRRTGGPKVEFPISSEEWRVRSGYIDNVAIVDGKLWIHEIKSSKAEKFDPLEETMPDHKIQTAIYVKTFEEGLASGRYAHISELEGFSEVHGVKFFYVNKNNTQVKEFSILRNDFEELIELVDVKARTVNKLIDKKELPEKTVGNCFFCPFYRKCGKDWNEVQTYEEKVQKTDSE